MRNHSSSTSWTESLENIAFTQTVGWYRAQANNSAKLGKMSNQPLNVHMYHGYVEKMRFALEAIRHGRCYSNWRLAGRHFQRNMASAERLTIVH